MKNATCTKCFKNYNFKKNISLYYFLVASLTKLFIYFRRQKGLMKEQFTNDKSATVSCLAHFNGMDCKIKQNVVLDQFLLKRLKESTIFVLYLKALFFLGGNVCLS